MGLNEVFLDGTYNTLINQYYSPEDEFMDSWVVYLRNGEVHIVGQEMIKGVVPSTVWHLTYDLNGREIDEESFASSTKVMTLSAYVPSDDKVYGYIEDTTTGIYTYVSAPGDDPTNVSVVAEGDFLVMNCFTYNAKENKLVGVGAGGAVYKVDKLTGAQTQIGTIANYSTYMTGICYSPYDNGYVYAVCREAANGGCSLDVLDSETFEVKSSTPYSELIEYYQLITPDVQNILPQAPGESKFVKAYYPNGSLEGAVTYRLASVNAGGTPILGDINWVLYIDDVEYRRGTAAAGSDVTIDATLTEGTHNLTFKASIGGCEGKYSFDSIFVGPDTPLAPTKVTLSEKVIAWKPVTAGIHDGYIDTNDLTYNVYLNDELVASEVTGTAIPTPLPKNQPYTSYVASVEAVCNGRVSARATSGDIQYGEPLDLPVHFDPTAEEAKLFTTFDDNDDGSEFVYKNEYNFGDQVLNVFEYVYNEDEDASDLVFLPPINFDDPDCLYRFTFDIFRLYESCEERYQVGLYTSPDPSDRVKLIKEPTYMHDDPSDRDFDNQMDEIYFNVPSAGTYYLGVHLISDADEYKVYVRDFSVEKKSDLTADSPIAVTGFGAYPAANGELKAQAQFYMPRQSFSGATYSTSDDVLTAEVQAEGCDPVYVEGAPGAKVVAYCPTKQGNNVVTVRAISPEGVKGIASSRTVYTGLDAAGLVTNVTTEILDDNLTLRLTWDAPTKGNDGGYVAPTGNKYYLAKYNAATLSWSLDRYIGEDVYTCDCTVTKNDPLALYRFAIIAENEIGMCDSMYVVSAELGTPYSMPATSSYITGNVLSPVVNFTSGVSLLNGVPGRTFSAFATADNAKALYTYSSKALTNAELTLPKFSTKDTKCPAIRLTIYGGSCKSFSIYGLAPGTLTKSFIKSYTSSNFTKGSRSTVTINLPTRFQDKEWVSLYIRYSTASKSESFILYSYEYIDNLDYDFGVTDIEGPSIARIGDECVYNAYAQNFGDGDYPFPGAHWSLTDKYGASIAEADVPATEDDVLSDCSVSSTITFTPTADTPSPLYLTYTINRDDDKEVNDSKTIEFTVAPGTRPVVTDLHAADISFDNVTLEWSEPSGQSRTESFENEETFVLDEDSDTVGDFTRYDGDKYYVWGPASELYDELPTAYMPQSFVVWSESELAEIVTGSNSPYKAHSGDKFLIAFCPSVTVNGAVPPADDWLISPQLVGGSTFSFFIKPCTYKYGAETVELLTSNGSNNPNDFELLDTITLSGVTGTTPVWEEVIVTLPEDAKYLAIHYVSTDIFGVLVDDISYTPVAEGSNIASYNIYRDSMPLESNAKCEGCRYTDSTVAENTAYSYMIVPVLNDGTLGVDSNILNLKTTGVDLLNGNAKAIYARNHSIIVKGYADKALTIATPQGTVIASTAQCEATATYAVGTGIYIVTVDGKSYKVLVP